MREHKALKYLNIEEKLSKIVANCIIQLDLDSFKSYFLRNLKKKKGIVVKTSSSNFHIPSTLKKKNPTVLH